MDTPTVFCCVKTPIQLAILSLIACCIGCVSVGHVPGRNYISSSMQNRTGHSLASKGDTTDETIPCFINTNEGLTETDAVTLALWNSPAYEELLTDLGLSRADVIRAGELKNPDFSILFPVGAKQLEYAINVPIDSIWLRPTRIKLAELQAKQVANRLVQDGLNFVRDVRVAHSYLLLAQEQWQVAQNRAALCERINKLAESRLRAGTTGELDVKTARIELTMAHERCERAEYDVKIAQERLRMLIGLGFSDVSIQATGQSIPSDVASDQQSLLETALSSRPDIWAAQYSVCAAFQQAELTRCDFLGITGIVSGKRNGADVGPGLAMTLPIFNKNEGAKIRAAWELKKARKHLESLQESVVSEVRRASFQFDLSQKNWTYWNDAIIPDAKEAVAISERAYMSGGDYMLNMLLNSQQLLDAELQRSQTASEMRCAVAELERSVGTSVMR